MQTPGRQVEPQTPMIAINRRVDMTLERLTKVEEDVVNIERPQRRIFSSVLSQLSEAVTTAAAGISSQLTVTFAGTPVNTGAVVSITVIVWV